LLTGRRNFTIVAEDAVALRVKICGISNELDAVVAARAGADAIGLNFYAKSPRCVSETQAVAIIRALPPFVEPVGLFVNEPWEKVAAAARRLGLRTVQIHADRMAPCPYAELRWLAARAVKDQGDLDDIKRLEDWPLAQRPAAILLDANVPGLYGGTGQQAPWDLLADLKLETPVILAGGLTPDNVAEAVRVVRPYGVDVASGVEARPGQKDHDKMRRFIAAARAAAE
jgi:phosphoribosylanthranilate isomerase